MALATLWANDVINGQELYSDVPNGLKEKVKEILKEKGCNDLVI
ncbi:hypothetical protein [Lachnoclostridium sp.]|nr:hypothetical protein [Lachnoclostridium sp.]